MPGQVRLFGLVYRPPPGVKRSAIPYHCPRHGAVEEVRGDVEKFVSSAWHEPSANPKRSRHVEVVLADGIPAAVSLGARAR